MSSDEELETVTLHENWEDVSDETGFEYHWHHKHKDEGYLSIRLADESSGIGLGGYYKGWTVEIYPDPDDEDGHMTRWHFSPDEYENPGRAAKQKVESLMERRA